MDHWPVQSFPPLPGWLLLWPAAVLSLQDARQRWDVYRLASAAATLTAELEAAYAFMRNGAKPSRSLLSCPVSLKVKFGSAMFHKLAVV